MTEKQLKELIEQGINPEELGKSISLMYMLSDMAEQYTIAVHTMLKTLSNKNHDRLTIGKIKRLSAELTRSTAKALPGDDLRMDFGDRVDFLREIIEEAMYINDEESRLKAISTMKILNK